MSAERPAVSVPIASEPLLRLPYRKNVIYLTRERWPNGTWSIVFTLAHIDVVDGHERYGTRVSVPGRDVPAVAEALAALIAGEGEAEGES